MRFRDWTTRVILIFLILATLILAIFIGGAGKQPNNPITSTPNPEVLHQYPYPSALLQSHKIIDQKQPNLPKLPNLSQSFVESNQKNQVSSNYITTNAFAKYKPNLATAKVHPSNYGERFTHDVNGLPVNNQPLIVLHETSNSASSAVNFFQTNNVDENVQASYHTLITLDGTVIYLVPPDKRAFGAGNSVFKGVNGVEETVKTNPNLPPSVNNFAYHVSLETPPDAWGKSHIKSHSGYTEDQYNSLAWLIAQSQVPDERITTHRDVDIANGKVDPVSFDFEKFFKKLHSFRELRSFNNAKR
jgi:hypothetical protein